MEKLAARINDLNNLIVQGKALEGFEKYYHDEVVIHRKAHKPIARIGILRCCDRIPKGGGSDRIRWRKSDDGTLAFRLYP